MAGGKTFIDGEEKYDINIATGDVSTDQIEPSAVTGPKIADNTIPGAKASDAKFMQTYSATGPASDTAVAAGSNAEISMTATLATTMDALATITPIGYIAPFPSGIVLQEFASEAISTSEVFISVWVYNPTASPITILANSVSVKGVAILL